MPIDPYAELAFHYKPLVRLPPGWGIAGNRHWCLKGYCEWQKGSNGGPEQHVYLPPHWSECMDTSLQPTDEKSIKQIELRKLEEEIEDKLLVGPYLIILQRLPPAIWYPKPDVTRTNQHQLEITCGYPYCPEKNNISSPGSFRISVEPILSFELDYVPRLPLGCDSEGNSDTSKSLVLGKGDKDASWFCLKCFEDLWDGVHVVAFENERHDDEGLVEERLLRRKEKNSRFALPEPCDRRPDLKVPSLYTDLVKCLRAEDREHRPDTGYYALSPVEEKAFCKWKAVHCHAYIRDNSTNRARMSDWSWPEPEPVRFHEDENGVGEAYMGEYEENLLAAMTIGSKRIVELDPADLKGRKLSHAMDLVDAQLQKFHREDGWEDPGPVPVNKGDKTINRLSRRFSALMSAQGNDDGDSDDEGKPKMVFTLPRIDSRPPTPGTLAAVKKDLA